MAEQPENKSVKEPLSSDAAIAAQTSATALRELRLEAENKSLAEIVNNIPAGVIVYRKTGCSIRIEAANKMACEIARAAKEQLVGVDVIPLIKSNVHPDDLADVLTRLDEMFSDGRHANFTYRSKNNAGGDYVWLKCQAVSVPQQDGSQLAYAVYADVTDQKQKEERFNRMLEQIDTLDPSSLGTFRLDLTDDLCLNGQSRVPGLVELLKDDTADGYIAKCLDTIADEGDRRAAVAQISRARLLDAYRAGKPELTCSFRRRDAEGSIRWATSYFRMVQNPFSGHIEAIVYTLDSEASVREKNIIEKIVCEEFEATAVINVRKRTISFSHVNAEAEKITPHWTAAYDKDVEEAMGIVAEPQDLEFCRAAASLDKIVAELEKSSMYTFSFFARDAEGSHYRKQLKYCYIDERRQEILITMADLTEEFRQQQEQMLRMKETLTAAEQANAAKSEFMSRVSHDIRTPMNIIKNMTDFAFQDLKDADKLREDLNKIRSANVFLLSLINDILDLEKIDSGRMELHPEPYSYEEFIGDIRNVLESLCAKRGLEYAVNTLPVCGTVLIDKVRLNQIMLNLVTNAVKYTRKGRVEVTASGLPGNDGRQMCRLSVKDTGIGMSAEFLARMFEPFSQDDSEEVRSLRAGGSGLGLSIVRKLVDLMGGRISAVSELGRGTEMVVELPAVLISDGAESRRETRKPVRENILPRGLKVLLAEDHPMNAEIAARILADEGLTVTVAENGGRAVDIFRRSACGEFGVVLMDIQMPVMNGYEATRAIRALKRPDAGLPVIAMTADAYSEDVKKCLEAGMNGHVSKPVDVNALFAEIARCLAHNRS